MLSSEDRDQELAQLKRLWEMHYEISTDGMDWVAKRRSGPGTVLIRPTSDSLRMAIRHDCCKADDGGYWVETMSGPPYYVAPLPATAKVPNSPRDSVRKGEGPRRSRFLLGFCANNGEAVSSVLKAGVEHSCRFVAGPAPPDPSRASCSAARNPTMTQPKPSRRSRPTAAGTSAAPAPMPRS